MRKNILKGILLLALFVVSCKKEVPAERHITPLYKPVNSLGATLWVTVIDSCEYIVVNNITGGLTHKGNCSNPIHYKSHETPK
jgi:hypothetical protein